MRQDQRWEGGSMSIQDDSALAMISHATEERMKCLIDQIRTIAQQRTSLSSAVRSTNGHHLEQDSQTSSEHLVTTDTMETRRKRPMDDNISTVEQRSSSTFGKSKNKKRKVIDLIVSMIFRRVLMFFSIQLNGIAQLIFLMFYA